jgi:hypothetical protein
MKFSEITCKEINDRIETENQLNLYRENLQILLFKLAKAT